MMNDLICKGSASAFAVGSNTVADWRKGKQDNELQKILLEKMSETHRGACRQIRFRYSFHHSFSCSSADRELLLFFWECVSTLCTDYFRLRNVQSSLSSCLQGWRKRRTDKQRWRMRRWRRLESGSMSHCVLNLHNMICLDNYVKTKRFPLIL